MTDTRERGQRLAEQVLENMRAVQSASVSAVGVWAQAAQKVGSKTPAPFASSWAKRLPDVSVVLDDVYDAFEKLIANQREFGHQLVAAAAPVVEGAPSEPAVKAAPAPKKK